MEKISFVMTAPAQDCIMWCIMSGRIYIKEMRNTRIITFEKIQNCREFGGLVTFDGKYIRREKLLRSANLSEATEEDIIKLKEFYNLKKIIDLRTTLEKEQKPDVKIEGVEYIHIPIFDEIKLGISHEKEADSDISNMNVYDISAGTGNDRNANKGISHGMSDDRNIDKSMSAGKNMPDMKDLYKQVVRDDECRKNLSRVLQIIMQHDYDTGSVLWHCTEGKDRCGLVAAFILSILTVDKNTILEDYLLTNEVNEPKAEMYYNRIIESGKPEAYALAIKNAFLAKEEYFNAAFDVVEKEYGGVAAYICDGLNIPEKMIEDFRGEMLSKYKYFVTNEERKKSLDTCKTCYFEFQKGYFHDEFWADDSLMLHMDYVDGLGLHACFRDVLPEYDYYDITNVDKKNWERILDYGMNVGGELKECIFELKSWVDECFDDNDCFKENEFFCVIGM